jgi:hypothetical protein
MTGEYLIMKIFEKIFNTIIYLSRTGSIEETGFFGRRHRIVPRF